MANSYFTANLIKITLANGFDWYITDFGESIEYNNRTYVPIKFSRSSTKRTLELVSQQINITFEDASQEVVPQTSIRKCFRNGMFDRAKIELSRFITKNRTYINPVNLFKGYFADAPTLEDGVLSASAQTYVYLFNQEFPKEIYTNLCNNKFRDYRCKYSVADVTDDLEFVSYNTAKLLTYPTGDVTNLLNGYIEFNTTTDFLLANKKMPIFNSWVSGSDVYVKFSENVPKQFTTESVTVARGCDKTQGTCNSLNNLSNFRGFSRIPRPEVML